MPEEPTASSPEHLGWASSGGPPAGHGTPSDRAWAVCTHLSFFLGGIVVPLAVVLVKGHRSAYVCHHAVEALNFHVTVLLAVFACSALAVVTVGLVLLPAILVAAAAGALRAALRADRGAWHRYPYSLRLVS